MGLVEMIVGLLGTAVIAPWIGAWGLKGYRLYAKRWNDVSAEIAARDDSKPIQQERAEELKALIHRQEVAKNTAYAIQAEAALALTEATIEKALSSGDLGLAKQGIQLALPSNGNAYAQQYPEPPMLESDVSKRLSDVVGQPHYPSEVVNPNHSPFRGQSTDFYLGLLRGGNVVPGVARNVAPGEYLAGNLGSGGPWAEHAVPVDASGALLDVREPAPSAKRLESDDTGMVIEEA